MAASRAAASVAAKRGLSNGGVAFFGGLCVGTFGLGCWQTQRYFEKVELVEKRERELAMEPVLLEPHAMMSREEFSAMSSSSRRRRSGPLAVFSRSGNETTTTTTGEKEQTFRRVRTTGTFRHEDEILIGPRGPPLDVMGTKGPMSGRSGGGMGTSPMGHYVVTPLVRSEGKGTVLVNRGWIPVVYEKKSYEWDRPLGEVEVEGVTSQAEVPNYISPEHTQGPGKLLWFDRKAMEEQTRTEGLAPLIVTETTTRNDHDDDGDKAVELRYPVRPFDTSVGEFKVLPPTHAGYAATWFGLSSAGVIMTRKMMLRGRG